MLQEAKVFDTSLYIHIEQETRGEVITEEVAGLVLEAGRRPLKERINPRRLKIENGVVIDPKTGKSVFEEFRYDSELARSESNTAESFYSYLVDNPPGSLVVSLSPSGGPAKYTEGRVNAGYRLNEENIELYGIPTLLIPSAMLSYAGRLLEWNSEILHIEKAEDLRSASIPILVPEGENPWLFLDRNAPLDSQAWQAILEGKPWIIKEQAVEDARPISYEMSRRLNFAASEMDYIRIGAYGERAMQKAGWELDSSGCPGLFNSQLLVGSTPFSQDMTTTFTKDSFGNIRAVKWEYHKGSCVNCSKTGVDVGPCSICKVCEKIL